MAYSSSLSDAGWEILEPLLQQLLLQKKRTRPYNWTKRELLDGILYQLKNRCPPEQRCKCAGGLVSCGLSNGANCRKSKTAAV